jgi:hypothetical protein
METFLEMFRRGDKEGIWRRYCWFVDMTTREFQATQERLLAEQLQAWRRSSLVRRIFGGDIPATIEDFRERAPLTTYADYAAVLLKKSDEELAEPTAEWVHTTGRSGEYQFKWIPYSKAMSQTVSDSSIGAFILGSCRKRGDIVLKERDRIMYTIAPPPYLSGVFVRGFNEQFNVRIWPPYEEAIRMDFAERIKKAVALAFSEGIDYFYGVTSLLVSISEMLENAGKGARTEESKRMMRNPKVVFRMLKGMIKARLRGGPLRPYDIWKVKGIICGGMDTAMYRERVREMWGAYPRESYACTEFGILAHQHWACPGQILRDTACYYEFMDLADHARWKADRSFRPPLKTLSEVQAGKEYALVGTSFHGGVLVRYVLGDSLTILSLSDEKNGVRVPQIIVASRIDDVIDIANFTRLTEKTIWGAVDAAGIPYVDWVIVKESSGDAPMLHLYLEPKNDGVDTKQAARLIHENLKAADPNYRDLEQMLRLQPLVVTLLSRGTFMRYQQERKAAGHDLGQWKPAHVNPKAENVARLLSMSSLKV